MCSLTQPELLIEMTLIEFSKSYVLFRQSLYKNIKPHRLLWNDGRMQVNQKWLKDKTGHCRDKPMKTEYRI